MSRKASRQDIKLVQDLIEQCLQLYMSQKEVMDILLVQEKIEPCFTELAYWYSRPQTRGARVPVLQNEQTQKRKRTRLAVWKKLEEENQEFFKAYHLRLMVKEQIVEFNRLLARQVELMHQVGPGASFIPMSNGSHISPMQQNSACYAHAPENNGHALKTESIQQPIASNLPNTFINYEPSMHSCMQPAVDMSPHSRRIDVSPNMLLAHNSNAGMLQGMNGRMIKTEAGYTGGSQFMYGADGNIVETRAALGDTSISPFSSVESSSHPLNDSLLDADSSSFGLLTSDFLESSDILGYSRSPFLATDTDSFLDSHGRRQHQGDNKRLDTISEGLSYDTFGSD
ncbi:hypothetical protein RJ639_007949 [Escallonia herrerae]|uniref:Uncharacterized protein n=1 Tax=Escallonia herrerae TaxID=1293975 RepID=A0AA88VW82_9ASTE|nr:hypothetical protein RJ639_007949 [Escallonia herrerae]